MHDSFRNGTVTAVTFAVLTVVSAFSLWSWIIWDSSRQYTEGQQAAHYYSAAEDERSKASIEAACVTKSTPGAIAKCVEEQIEASRSYKRSERDLSAQESMAYWAFGMLLVSLATMAVTGAGVWLIYDTLLETRKAVGAAIDATNVTKNAAVEQQLIGEAQVRSYLTCLGGHFEFDDTNLFVYPVFKNTGQSPTSKIEISANIFFTYWLPSDSGDTPQFNTSRVNAIEGTGCAAIPSGSESEGFIMWYYEAFEKIAFDLLKDGRTTMYIQGKARWKDVFDKDCSIDFNLSIAKKPGEKSSSGVFREGKLTAYNHGTRTTKDHPHQ